MFSGLSLTTITSHTWCANMKHGPASTLRDRHQRSRSKTSPRSIMHRQLSFHRSYYNSRPMRLMRLKLSTQLIRWQTHLVLSNITMVLRELRRNMCRKTTNTWCSRVQDKERKFIKSTLKKCFGKQLVFSSGKAILICFCAMRLARMIRSKPVQSTWKKTNQMRLWLCISRERRIRRVFWDCCFHRRTTERKSGRARRRPSSRHRLILSSSSTMIERTNCSTITSCLCTLDSNLPICNHTVLYSSSW